MFLSKIGKFFGKLIKSIFGSIEKEYNKLPEPQKLALAQGVGLVDILNQYVGQSPAAVRQAIQAKFPDVSVPVMEALLFKLAATFGLKDIASLDDAIVLVQKHLTETKANDSKLWASISHGAAATLSILFAPPETKFGAIISFIEFVYQKFFKKAL